MEIWNAAPVKVSSGVWFSSDFLSFSVSLNYLDLLQMCPLFTSPPEFGHSASFHGHNYCARNTEEPCDAGSTTKVIQPIRGQFSTNIDLIA